MIMLFFFLNWRLDAQVVLQYSTEMFKDRKKKKREREREWERKRFTIQPADKL